MNENKMVAIRCMCGSFRYKDIKELFRLTSKGVGQVFCPCCKTAVNYRIATNNPYARLASAVG